MGIFDIFRRHKDENTGGSGTALKDRVTGMAAGHGDQVNRGLDKAGQMADEKTGNRYSDQINTGVNKTKDMFGQQTGQGSGAVGESTPETPNPGIGTQADDTQPQPPQS